MDQKRDFESYRRANDFAEQWIDEHIVSGEQEAKVHYSFEGGYKCVNVSYDLYGEQYYETQLYCLFKGNHDAYPEKTAWLNRNAKAIYELLHRNPNYEDAFLHGIYMYLTLGLHYREVVRYAGSRQVEGLKNIYDWSDPVEAWDTYCIGYDIADKFVRHGWCENGSIQEIIESFYDSRKNKFHR